MDDFDKTTELVRRSHQKGCFFTLSARIGNTKTEIMPALDFSEIDFQSDHEKQECQTEFTQHANQAIGRDQVKCMRLFIGFTVD